jgi:hypothetical protein
MLAEQFSVGIGCGRDTAGFRWIRRRIAGFGGNLRPFHFVKAQKLTAARTARFRVRGFHPVALRADHGGAFVRGGVAPTITGRQNRAGGGSGGNPPQRFSEASGGQGLPDRASGDAIANASRGRDCQRNAAPGAGLCVRNDFCRGFWYPHLQFTFFQETVC